MFLKSLEVKGFKSFADKTELKFKQGVTAVVGPNGSGKSNISDAVRWVLGEQSIKTLRGGKMEDVIFAGTQYRKPLGLAQVSLTLDNSNGGLQTEYNEVVVSRRIFRSGESEYLINNTKCRLKDITNLFLDTGIGKEGYSLIGQGKIEAILSGKAEDRRILLEEAAGIVKYKLRKNESEKKLSNTDENLIRIRDIISTYEERLEPLRIDCEKAIKFNNLSNGLKEKEVSLILHNIKEIDRELSFLKEDIKKREESLNEKKTTLNEERENLKSIEKKIEKIESNITDKKLEYYTKKEGITKGNSDIKLFNERISNFNNILEKNKYEENTLKNKLLEIKEEKENLKEKLKLKKKDYSFLLEKINYSEKENLVLNEKIKKLEEKISFIRENRFSILGDNSKIENEITKIKTEINSKKELKERISINLQELEKDLNLNESQINSLNISLKSLEENLYLLKEEIILKRKELSNLNKEIISKENLIKGLNISLSKLEANKNMLNDLENQYEGYNKSLKNLMDRIYKGKIDGINKVKVLGEVFSVNKEYEVAIERALGGAISNVITEDDILAKKLVSYLKKEKLGRITFLPLNIINSKSINLGDSLNKIDGYIGIASEIISFDSKYKKAIDYSLGRTIIAKDMDSAFNIGKHIGFKFKIVTLEGEVLNSGGALTGGSIRGKNSNILSRKREIEEIEIKIENEKEKLNSLEKELNDFRRNKVSLEENIILITDKGHDFNLQIQRDKNKILNIYSLNKNINISLDKENKQFENLDLEMINLKEELEKNKNKLKELNLKKSFNEEEENEILKELDLRKKENEESNLKLIDLKIKKASLDEVLDNLENTSFIKEDEILKINEKLNFISNENKESLIGIEKSKEDIKSKEEKIKEFISRLEELDNIFKELEIKKLYLKEEFKKIDSLINDIRETINKEESFLNKKEIGKAKFEIEKENIYKKLNEELDLTLAEANEMAIIVDDINELKEEISSLKRKISSLGTVNLGSIEEYEIVKEKFEFMKNQEEDLEKAKEDLLEVIDEMTKKMRKQFSYNFKIINKNFNETFNELFKGGSAELILGEGDELKSDIHINVQPPGKKLQNINLMSGGEKVLSAIALLFAILKMKPTPFCILDEIEAALDDANVYRYAEFLKSFSDKIQFIVITHRKGTMEASDVMYGVTMEEKGISKVVSVDLTR